MSCPFKETSTTHSPFLLPACPLCPPLSSEEVAEPPLLPLPSFLSFHNLLNKLYRDSLCMACGSVSFPHQLQLLEGPATPLTNPPPKVSHPPPPTRLGLTEAWGGGTQVPSWPTAASQELQRFTETITIMRTLVIKAWNYNGKYNNNNKKKNKESQYLKQ